MYVIIRDDLGKVLGEKVARMKKAEMAGITGFDLDKINQIPSKKISIIGVSNEDKAKKYGEIVTEAVASKTYTDEQDEGYRVANEGLMNANLLKADIDFSQMDIKWTEQKELEFLNENNISGITKIEKKVLV